MRKNIVKRQGDWSEAELAYAKLAVLAIKRGASYYGQSKLLAAATGRTLEAARMKIRGLLDPELARLRGAAYRYNASLKVVK